MKKACLTLIVILLSCRWGHAALSLRERPPEAVRGTLDLRHWDLGRDRPVPMKGEWEFHWKRLLDPGTATVRTRTEQVDLIQVPSVWNDQVINGERLTGEGYATYRLRILLGENREALAIKFPDMVTAYTAFANGKRLCSNGVAGTGRKETVPERRPVAAELDPSAGEIDLVIHVSNYHHIKGGMRASPTLGSREKIYRARERQIALELFLFGTILLMGLSQIVYFLHRTKDRSTLYFGLLCLLASAYTMSNFGEMFLINLVSGLSWELKLKADILSWALIVPLSLLFLRKLFPAEFGGWLLKLMIGPVALLSICVILFPARIHLHLLLAGEIMILSVCVYGILVIAHAAARGRDGAVVFLAGGFVLLATVVNDFLFENHVLQTGYYAPFGIMFFIFSQAFVMLRRYAGALYRLEDLSGRLEQLVGERTAELLDQGERLRAANEEIEKVNRELEEKNRLLEEASSYFYERSIRDSLTGLYNHQHIMQILEDEIHRVRRYELPLSLLMIDIDHFKNVNDAHGHLAGDSVLVSVSQILRESIRPSDYAGRYGGEEFLVVFTHTSLEDSRVVAERIRAGIESGRFGEAHVRITASLGLAQYGGEPLNDFVRRVDGFLYLAKERGRNRVEA